LFVQPLMREERRGEEEHHQRAAEHHQRTGCSAGCIRQPLAVV
jgi:hypothetical protein